MRNFVRVFWDENEEKPIYLRRRDGVFLEEQVAYGPEGMYLGINSLYEEDEFESAYDVTTIVAQEYWEHIHNKVLLSIGEDLKELKKEFESLQTDKQKILNQIQKEKSNYDEW